MPVGALYERPRCRFCAKPPREVTVCTRRVWVRTDRGWLRTLAATCHTAWSAARFHRSARSTHPNSVVCYKYRRCHARYIPATIQGFSRRPAFPDEYRQGGTQYGRPELETRAMSLARRMISATRYWRILIRRATMDKSAGSNCAVSSINDPAVTAPSN